MALEGRRQQRHEIAERRIPATCDPQGWPVGDDPLSFQVLPGGVCYYDVVLAAHPDLFKAEHHSARHPNNFYASWEAEGQREAPGPTVYTLPPAARR